VSTMAQTIACLWYGTAFERRRDGGKSQRFCSPTHRRAFETAARTYVRRAIEDGTLTVANLREAAGTTRALHTAESRASLRLDFARCRTALHRRPEHPVDAL